MKKNTKRYVTSVTLNSEHFLANVFALTKLLGMQFSVARTIVKGRLNTKIDLVPYHEIKSDLNVDDLLSQLDEYEIKVTIINQ